MNTKSPAGAGVGRYLQLIWLTVGCAGNVDIVDPRLGPSEVVAEFDGEFDGEHFVLRPVSGAGTGGTLGVNVQALDHLDAGTFSSTTVATGTNYVALEQTHVAQYTGGAASNNWAFAGCGTPAAPHNAGVCARIGMRNMFEGYELARAYVELVSLTPGPGTTAVEIAAPGSDRFTGVPDFGATPVKNGLWRYGGVGRSTPFGAGPFVRWAYHGTVSTPGAYLRFNFRLRVRGILMRPTQRASLQQGVLDSPLLDYVDRTLHQIDNIDGSVALSADGRYVVFASSSLDALDDFPLALGTHIFRKDMETGALELVSRTDTGAVPTGLCTTSNPHISADGKVVVFTGFGCAWTGSPLLPSLVTPQIYVRVLEPTSFAPVGTKLLSRSTSGSAYADRTTANPRISANGRYAVFNSDSTNLISGHPGFRSGCQEVYRVDVSTGAIRRVTRPYDGSGYAYLDGALSIASCVGDAVPGREPDISGDGRYVVFESGLRLRSSEDTVSNDLDVYVYDDVATVAAGDKARNWRVSKTRANADPNGWAQNATVSADGSTVAFISNSTNLLATATSGREQVYARNLLEANHASIEMISMDDFGVEGGSTAIVTPYPALSTTGRFVAFWSAYHLETPVPSPGVQVHVCDRMASSAALRRCFVASAAQVTPSSPFTLLTGNGPVRYRIGLSSDGDNDERAYVTYLGKGTSWGLLGQLISFNQVFVSPVTDPRTQMPGVLP